MGSGQTEIQNSNGLLFFIANLVGMSSISGSILTCKIKIFSNLLSVNLISHDG